MAGGSEAGCAADRAWRPAQGFQRALDSEASSPAFPAWLPAPRPPSSWEAGGVPVGLCVGCQADASLTTLPPSRPVYGFL